MSFCGVKVYWSSGVCGSEEYKSAASLSAPQPELLPMACDEKSKPPLCATLTCNATQGSLGARKMSSE